MEKITIKNGRMTIVLRVSDLLEGLDTESRAEFVDDCSTQSDVIRQVMSQVLTGLTDLGSHGAETLREWTGTYPTALDEARRNVREFAEPATQERMKVLSAQLERMTTDYNELHCKLFDVTRAHDEAMRYMKAEREAFDNMNAQYHALLAAQTPTPSSQE